ncbi:hypothetical protein JNK13_01355 [bacterium]|nr:hypothetical protein [bacterium]
MAEVDRGFKIVQGNLSRGELEELYARLVTTAQISSEFLVALDRKLTNRFHLTPATILNQISDARRITKTLIDTCEQLRNCLSHNGAGDLLDANELIATPLKFEEKHDFVNAVIFTESKHSIAPLKPLECISVLEKIFHTVDPELFRAERPRFAKVLNRTANY